MELRIRVETVFENGSPKRCLVEHIRRPVEIIHAESLGLSLAEEKTLLRKLQETVWQHQIDEFVQERRTCCNCGNLRAIHDDRGRVIDTLFGRLTLKSPRLRQCSCLAAGARDTKLLSPVAELLTDRANPELKHLQTELGSRHSFREAARLMETFLPCAPQSNTTLRNRLGRIAKKLSCLKNGDRETAADNKSDPMTVFLDGAHIRCRPEYQKRHLDVVVGKIETPGTSRRFGLVQQGAKSPVGQLRDDMLAQGWDGQSQVTVISDGEPALPNLVRTETKWPVPYILDWWHVWMRIQHIKNAVKGLLQTDGFSGMPQSFKHRAETPRCYLWHGYVMTAGSIISILKSDCEHLQEETTEIREAAKRVKARCTELYTYLRSNLYALTDYDHCHRNGLAVASSRAEGCVDDIGNTRMGKKRRMRWSPQGAYRVAITRPAVFDGRLTVSKIAA